MLSMMSTQRVAKRKAPAKDAATLRRRGRGRPSEWSGSWQKKLVILRLCGLQLSEIIDMLNILGGGTFKAKERRAQQILRELLSAGYFRCCASEKTVVRRRLAFMRALHERSSNAVERVQQRQTSLESVKYSEPLLGNPAQESLFDATPALFALSRPEGARDITEFITNETAMLYREPTHLNPLDAVVERSGSEVNVGRLDTDNGSFMSNRSRRIRDLLRRASYSSSAISDIKSVLNMRFSLSSSATTNRLSISMMSTIDDEMELAPSSHELRASVERALDTHRYNIYQANKALIDTCCLNNTDCIHKYIRDATIGFDGLNLLERLFLDCPILFPDWRDSRNSRNWEDLRQYERIREVNCPDTYGNNALFFAARSGAPVNALLILLDYTLDLNAINDQGQTFLFLLEPHDESFLYCQCEGRWSPHGSGFECLIRRLQRLDFDFDCVDYNGRHFMSYLCTSAFFKPQWLVPLIQSEMHSQWSSRLKVFLALRDNCGATLFDFLSSNEVESVLADYMLLLPHPLYSIYPTFVPSIRKPLFEEDHLGKTQTHNFIQSNEYIRSSKRLGDQFSGRSRNLTYVINNYDARGHTPLMDFVDRAIDKEIDGNVIVTKAQDLISCGASVHSRARDGSTVLHLAAKRSCPELLEYFLSIGAHVDHLDNAGCRALDYARINLTSSRRLRAPARDTARSFSAATKILDYAKLGINSRNPEKAWQRQKRSKK